MKGVVAAAGDNCQGVRGENICVVGCGSLLELQMTNVSSRLAFVGAVMLSSCVFCAMVMYRVWSMLPRREAISIPASVLAFVTGALVGVQVERHAVRWAHGVRRESRSSFMSYWVGAGLIILIVVVLGVGELVGGALVTTMLPQEFVVGNVGMTFVAGVGVCISLFRS
jgi:hypothetical protein